MSRIGILGSGAVGQTLAKGLRDKGHEVRMGSRNPEKLKDFTAANRIEIGTFSEVARWGETLVLAVLGKGAEEALRLAGPENLKGKPVLDTTNPLTGEPPQDGVLRVFTGPNESLMERLQEAYPEAHLVKAFNSVGSALMVDPPFGTTRPTMFYCGNDTQAKAAAARLIEQLGWEGADMGSAVAARAIEPLCQLWCIPGFRENEWASHAFHLLRR